VHWEIVALLDVAGVEHYTAPIEAPSPHGPVAAAPRLIPMVARRRRSSSG
jgi:hypothetical protein